ncbi:MAG: hypothetical protein HXS48_09355 [Theionarchaea archaeon]|nr:MAG: hypothetical protein AYK19_18400 [Theionarchaea archaeon DG-70-1]MBU7027138.1 hypothetical protein [Theionarchaea archaeon]
MWCGQKGGQRYPHTQPALRTVIIETFGSAIRIFNEALVKVSPTSEKDAEEVVRILEKYKPPESNGR